jgi:dCMP deaminase
MLSATIAATRSSCIKFNSWAVIVKNKRIVSSWYNGNPTWVPSCHEQWFCNKDEAWVDRSSKWSWHCLATHAEANAIVQNHEQSLEWATMYSLHFPCNECAKLIASSWIKEVVYLKMYRESVPKAELIFNHAWITFRQMDMQNGPMLKKIEQVMISTIE